MKTIDRIKNKLDDKMMGFDLLILELDDSPENKYIKEAYEQDKTELFISKQIVKKIWKELEDEDLKDNE